MKNDLKALRKRLHGRRDDLLELGGMTLLLLLFTFFGFFLGMISAVKELAVWEALVTASEPEVCALCENGNGVRYHAPCLVNLTTGAVGELRVYDPDPRRRGEIAAVQQAGTFSLMSCAGAEAVRDTDAHTCRATLPKKGGNMAPGHFCRACRALLADTAKEGGHALANVVRSGYILVDLYDLTDIRLYPIREGADYAVREYEVSVFRQGGRGPLCVEAAG